jgi:hypothetical protein
MKVLKEYIRNNAQENILSVECIIWVHNTERIKYYNFVFFSQIIIVGTALIESKGYSKHVSAEIRFLVKQSVARLNLQRYVTMQLSLQCNNS